MTVDESKALKKDTRVYWRGNAADSGIITETSWDAVTIAWNNGEMAEYTMETCAKFGKRRQRRILGDGSRNRLTPTSDAPTTTAQSLLAEHGDCKACGAAGYIPTMGFNKRQMEDARRPTTGGSMSSGMAGRMLAPRTAGIYVRWGAYWLWIWRQLKCLLQDQSRKAAASFVRIAEPFMR